MEIRYFKEHPPIKRDRAKKDWIRTNQTENIHSCNRFRSNKKILNLNKIQQREYHQINIFLIVARVEISMQHSGR